MACTEEVSCGLEGLTRRAVVLSRAMRRCVEDSASATDTKWLARVDMPEKYEISSKYKEEFEEKERKEQKRKITMIIEEFEYRLYQPKL